MRSAEIDNGYSVLVPASARGRLARAATMLVLLLAGLAALALVGGEGTRWFAWLSLAVAACLAAVVLRVVARAQADCATLAALAAAGERLARTDPVTGIANRSALTELLVRASTHARRRVEPLSVLLLELDQVGEIGARHGSAASDGALRALAECLRGELRTGDVFGYLGGDQFLVVLQGTIREEAEIVAERLRAAAMRIELPEVRLPHGLTLSVGCATAVHATPELMLGAAQTELEQRRARRSVLRRSADAA